MILAASQSATENSAPDPDLVTPGTIGFVVTLAIVIVVIFLIRDALKRVRRVRARSETSDAYPIPLRKHAVPNQSKQSGPDAPETPAPTTETSAEAAAGGPDDVESGTADGPRTPKDSTEL